MYSARCRAEPTIALAVGGESIPGLQLEKNAFSFGVSAVRRARAFAKRLDDPSENVWFTPESLTPKLQVSTESVMGWRWSGQLIAIHVASKSGGCLAD